MSSLFVVIAYCLLGVSSLYGQQMSVASGTAGVNGGKLYYETMGEGHPLVLIHGGGVDRRMWDDQFKAFAGQYKVIRYDLRGSGKSEIPRERWSHSQDLYSLLRFLNVDKVYVLGLSRGGWIAANYDREATIIPGARKVVIPGAAHYVPMERPVEFNRIVLDFLGKLSKK